MTTMAAVYAQSTFDEITDAAAAPRLHNDDHLRIREAIQADAHTHGGLIDQNRVRARLTNEHGLTVDPHQLSGTYSRMRREQLIERSDQWSVNDDKRGRNAGKPVLMWRWIA